MFGNKSYRRRRWTADECRLMLANYNSNAIDINNEFIILSQLLKRSFNSIKAQINRLAVLGIKTPQDFERHYGENYQGYLPPFENKKFPDKTEKKDNKVIIASQPIFRFRPFQKVRVIDFDINYEGRIIRCIWENGNFLYDIELWIDGDPRRREFYQFQLESMEK